MDVLALIHGDNVRAGVFVEAVEARGDRLDEWNIAWGTPPPRPVDEYPAVIVLGGTMHPDQDDQHPWLAEETALLRRLVERGVPLLGVCLGVQMLARAAGAEVKPCPAPEIGWHEVELTAGGRSDPLFAGLPGSFPALVWHHYTYDLPPDAVELARSAAHTQAFRLGETTWGVQFHPEVTEDQIHSWMADEAPEDLPMPAAELRSETRLRIRAWNDFGRTMCTNFLALAEGLRAAA